MRDGFPPLDRGELPTIGKRNRGEARGVIAPAVSVPAVGQAREWKTISYSGCGPLPRAVQRQDLGRSVSINCASHK
eukprot:scaffold1966_cov118-Isochrysis_galbana.AAC.2